MYDTTRLLLLLVLLSALVACLLPSLSHCYIIVDEDDVDDVDDDTDAAWKRGYAGNVVPDPQARSPMTAKWMTKYLQNLASRRFVSDSEMAKRQVHVGLRLVPIEALRKHMETMAATRLRNQLGQNQELMSRVGRR